MLTLFIFLKVFIVTKAYLARFLKNFVLKIYKLQKLWNSFMHFFLKKNYIKNEINNFKDKNSCFDMHFIIKKGFQS